MRTFSKASRVLGDLETRVMELLWEEHPLSVRAACERLRGDHAYTTIMTTMDRLHKKRLLRRKKDGNAFLYEPAMDRAEYQKRVVEAALTPLLEQGAAAIDRTRPVGMLAQASRAWTSASGRWLSVARPKRSRSFRSSLGCLRWVRF